MLFGGGEDGVGRLAVNAGPVGVAGDTGPSVVGGDVGRKGDGDGGGRGMDALRGFDNVCGMTAIEQWSTWRCPP